MEREEKTKPTGLKYSRAASFVISRGALKPLLHPKPIAKQDCIVIKKLISQMREDIAVLWKIVNQLVPACNELESQAIAMYVDYRALKVTAKLARRRGYIAHMSLENSQTFEVMEREYRGH